MSGGTAALTAGQRLKVGIKGTIGLKGVRDVRILAGPARGIAMTLDFSGHTPMYLGMFEWELHRFFARALKDAELVLDVGGYVGYDALLFARASRGRVITFEPNVDQARILRANLEQNGSLAERISINANSVTDVGGTGQVTIDEVAATFGVPDVVKIDIDGGETRALLGALKTLRERRPHLVVETHSLQLERECGALLVQCGYTPIIKHNRRVWREHRAGAPHNRWLLAEGRPRSH